MNLKEFKTKFIKLKEKGYIPSKRNGPTGIGYTLESSLGILENNNVKPDIEGAELKAHRTKEKSLITLFTFNNKAWKTPPLEAVRKYGSLDAIGRKGLYYTMFLKPNSAGLFIEVTKAAISVRHISGETIASWSLQNLTDRFIKKIPALIFVSAHTEERAGKEHFHFYRAQLMEGTSSELLENQFKEENILVDLRLHDKGTSARNHGTGFRVYEYKLPLLFKNYNMRYLITRNEKYDFLGQSYAAQYPNIHKYPATMIPQIGIELLKEVDIDNGKLFDPYCGSGSSFIAGLENDFSEMDGFDINPLAVLISRTKFSKIDINKVEIVKQNLRNDIYDFIKQEVNINNIQITQYNNIDYWFSKPVLQNLSILKYFISKINKDIQQIFLVPFSETIRECSYTRNNEFKLYRIKPEEVLQFTPDVFSVFFNKLNKAIEIYKKHYLPKINNAKISIHYSEFANVKKKYDVVLTSPPYGDSFTTVAYGQFSMFSNQWLGFENARQIDNMLMGGHNVKQIYNNSVITEYVKEISIKSKKRALEVS
ncbi:MAG: MvaI/BcnI family restriction endonuclease [Endomicrobium sp.]|nr:MvaI/BcnI family restriction endonuclease [Endomicrobium sp.]